MSILFFDGFEQYGADSRNMATQWASVSSNHSLSLDRARSGLYSLKISEATVTTEITSYAVSDASNYTLGCSVWLPNLPTLNRRLLVYELRVNSGGSYIADISVFINTTGAIEVVTTSSRNTSLGESSTPYIVPRTWHHIETKIVSDASGSVEVRVDNRVALSASGNTNPEGSPIERIVVGQLTGVGGVATGVDDFYIDCFEYSDGDFIGDSIVTYMYPNADTAQADWSWTAGPVGHDMIDQGPPVYNEGSGNYDSNFFIFANEPGSPTAFSIFELEDSGLDSQAVIHGVTAAHFSTKNNPAAVSPSVEETVDVQLLSNSVSTSFSSDLLSDSQQDPLDDAETIGYHYRWYLNVSETNPDTLSAYTAADLDDLQIRIERLI